MTLRLIRSVTADINAWSELDGMMAAQGADPLTLPLDRFLSLAYWYLTRGADAAAIEAFNRRLWMPPKGVTPDRRSPWSAENETAAFQAFKRQTTGTPTATT